MKYKTESGNAVIYVLILVVLFAALGFTLSRQSDSSETSGLDAERNSIMATQLIEKANQVKQTVDQMIFSGSAFTPTTSDLVFITPDDAAFNTAPNIHKVWHPSGGGMTLPTLPPDAVHQVDADPVAGWYLGLFNNVEWTPTTATDVVLTAHQISEQVCQQINKKITGTTTIPVLAGAVTIKEVLIDTAKHSGGANGDLDTTSCPAGCDGMPSLCISNNAGTMWSFYSLIESR